MFVGPGQLKGKQVEYPNSRNAGAAVFIIIEVILSIHICSASTMLHLMPRIFTFNKLEIAIV